MPARKTRREIIDETAKAYTLSTRSVDSLTGHCVYVGEDGCRCAFARCMADPSEAREGMSAREVIEDLGYKCLKPQYRVKNAEFWNSIQLLHDAEHNWKESGLSAAGARAVKDLHVIWDERV